MEQDVFASKGASDLSEVFLKSSTTPGFWRILMGLPRLRFIFRRLQRSLTPPIV
jgi:hypothetical protein